MNLIQIKEGIRLEVSNTFIPWELARSEASSRGNPEISFGGGLKYIFWRNESVLGVVGDWSISFFEHEESMPIQRISLYQDGDRNALAAFEKTGDHLVNLFGPPTSVSNEPKEKYFLWLEGDLYVSLYFFEMHDYKCRLSLGNAYSMVGRIG